ncbi:DUF2335 domain-containing protein [bacterium]|nr:DUF2335 domain-containing protein [bacterium]
MSIRTRPVERAMEFLPAPETLQAYNNVIAGSAETILALLEKEQQHRHQMEEKLAQIQQSGMYFGQILSFIVAMTVVIGSIVLGLNGQAELAAGLGFVGLTCMTVGYVKGRELTRQASRKTKVAVSSPGDETSARSPITIGPARHRANIPL